MKGLFLHSSSLGDLKQNLEKEEKIRNRVFTPLFLLAAGELDNCIHALNNCRSAEEVWCPLLAECLQLWDELIGKESVTEEDVISFLLRFKSVFKAAKGQD